MALIALSMNAMSIIKPISIKLQFGYYDIVKAYSEVKFVIDELSTLRLSTLRSNDGMLHSWYVQAEKLAEDIQVPRTTRTQRHRDNTEHSSVEEYYRRCTVIPLLDNLIQQMKDRFSNTQVTASKLLYLVPSQIPEESDELTKSLEDVVVRYGCDMPNSEVFVTEVWRWRVK